MSQASHAGSPRRMSQLRKGETAMVTTSASRIGTSTPAAKRMNSKVMPMAAAVTSRRCVGEKWPRSAAGTPAAGVPPSGG